MNNKKECGITLIALVITIVILVIIAGVSINMTLGQNGIFNKATTSKKEYSQNEAKEKLELVLVELQMDKVNNGEYNNQEYATKKLEENLMEVNKNIITVNGYNFVIDRETLTITGENKKNIFDQDKANTDLTISNVEIDENGVATFTKDNAYIKLNNSFEPQNENWEVSVKVLIDKYTSSYQAIIGKDGGYDPPTVFVSSSGKLAFSISSNGTSWNVVNKTGTKTIEVNKWYWIKLIFDGTKYQVLVSDDGINYIEDIVVNTTAISAQGNSICLGRNVYISAGTKAQLYGKIDLLETYIKYANTYAFAGDEYLKVVDY